MVIENIGKTADCDPTIHFYLQYDKFGTQQREALTYMLCVTETSYFFNACFVNQAFFVKSIYPGSEGLTTPLKLLNIFFTFRYIFAGPKIF